METKYDLDYFIKKFEAIPEEMWCEGSFRIGDKCCALGHCGAVNTVHTTKESSILYGYVENIGDINDGSHKYLKYGTTPKERVINYLKELRDK